MGRLYLSLRQRGHRHIADVTVARELNPAKTFVILVKHHCFAIERLGVEGRIGGWRMAQIGGADADMRREALDIIIGRDLATQIGGREVGAGRSQAGVEGGHVNRLSDDWR